MTIDLDELERKARAATPGPWTMHENGDLKTVDLPTDHVSTVAFAKVVWHGGEPFGFYEIDPPDRAHIAAASPDVILALVQRVREAEAKVLELEDSVRTVLSNNEHLIRAVNEAPEFERSLKLAMMTPAGLVSWLRAMSDTERLAIIEALSDNYCMGCGTVVPPRCHCQNDE